MFEAFFKQFSLTQIKKVGRINVGVGVSQNKDLDGKSNHTEQDFGHVQAALSALPNFNADALNQLVLDTEPSVVLRILARYSLNLAEAFVDIETALVTDNADLVWRSCHKLIGTAELIGFKKFGEKSRELNLDIKASLDLHAHVDELSTYLDEGQMLLKNIRACFPSWSNYL